MLLFAILRWRGGSSVVVLGNSPARAESDRADFDETFDKYWASLVIIYSLVTRYTFCRERSIRTESYEDSSILIYDGVIKIVDRKLVQTAKGYVVKAPIVYQANFVKCWFNQWLCLASGKHFCSKN